MGIVICHLVVCLACMQEGLYTFAGARAVVKSFHPDKHKSLFWPRSRKLDPSVLITHSLPVPVGIYLRLIILVNHNSVRNWFHLRPSPRRPWAISNRSMANILITPATVDSLLRPGNMECNEWRVICSLLSWWPHDFGKGKHNLHHTPDSPMQTWGVFITDYLHIF